MTNLTREQRAALNTVAAAVEKPRPAGYDINARLINELVEKGLIAIKAELTDAGRRALEES